ncbi:hypothetical protein AAVH_09105 [Aphelenchoides avenae]|nr:hypothetical protein AAVH_09105 [Aphelenchus avenae]
MKGDSGPNGHDGVVDGPPRSVSKKGVVDFGDDESDDEPLPTQSLQGPDSATLKHKRFCCPANVPSVLPKTECLHNACLLRATVPPVQVKHEEDDAGSHLTDSRLSARRNTPTRQEEYSATTSGARNVDVKQEQEIVEAAHAFPLGDVKHEDDGARSNVADSRLRGGSNTSIRHEEGNATVTPGAQRVDVKQESVQADVPRDNIDLLVQEIVREGAKLEDAYVHDEGREDAPSMTTPPIVEPAATNASVTYPVGRETRVVRLRSGTEVRLVPRRSTGTPPSSAKEPASLFARKRERRERLKTNKRKQIERERRQIELLEKLTADAEADAEADAKTHTLVEEQVVSRKRRNADTGDDADLTQLSDKRKQVLRKLQRREAEILKLETVLQDESRVPAWTSVKGSVGWWRRTRTAKLHEVKQERVELLAELKVTEGVLVLYRAARRWYIDHGKSREFFKKLREDGNDRPEKIVRHFWKGVSHVDRDLLFKLCVTESAFLFNSEPHKLKAWREAFASEKGFNDYFNDVLPETA